MADEPVAVANTLASPLGPDRVGQVGENFRKSDILLFEVEQDSKRGDSFLKLSNECET